MSRATLAQLVSNMRELIAVAADGIHRPDKFEQAAIMRARVALAKAEQEGEDKDLRADAERYRWLRDNYLMPLAHPNGDAWGMTEVIYGEDLEAAIDAQRSKS